MGIKGAIMLSYIRFIYPDKKCTYLPENDKDFNEYEKSFFMDKEGIREAVILTDVVVSGKTVSGFIKKIKESIGGLSKVKVVTVFKARDLIDIPNDDDNLIISVCSLVDIMINNCSGKGSSCEIYTKKLAHVIEFEEGKR
jgi:orotate phosphoribosyltransferase-like protein